MRIIVASDSHGDTYGLKKAVEQQPTAKAMYFLGDGEYDIELIKSMFPMLPVFSVRGNCDYASALPCSLTDIVENNTIYVTHGFAEQVKSTKAILWDRAREKNASIALYGHTHFADTTYYDGIWLVNPGSIRNDEYAVIDITQKGIMPILMKIK